MRQRSYWVVVGLVVLRCLLLTLQLSRLPDDVSGNWIANDAVRFHAIATSPGQAWRDFEVEFPPLTVAMIETSAGVDAHSTAVRLAWGQFVLDVAVVGALAWAWGSRAAIAYLLISLPLVPMIYFRLDLLSVALAVLAMALVAKRAPLAGGVGLSAAVFAKFWPAVLVVGLAAQRRWRAVASFALATAVGLLAWVGLGGTDAVRQVATFRGAQGWQIESAVGSVLLRFTDRPVVWEADANRIGSAVGARSWMIVILLAGLVAVGVLAYRRGTPDLGVAALASVALLLLTAPILSWQYVIWMAPWAALAWTEGERIPAGTAFVAIALTMPLVPLGVELTERQPLATNLLLVRNLVLIALVGICLLALSVRGPERWETGSHEPEPPLD